MSNSLETHRNEVTLIHPFQAGGRSYFLIFDPSHSRSLVRGPIAGEEATTFEECILADVGYVERGTLSATEERARDFILGQKPDELDRDVIVEILQGRIVNGEWQISQPSGVLLTAPLDSFAPAKLEMDSAKLLEILHARGWHLSMLPSKTVEGYEGNYVATFVNQEKELGTRAEAKCRLTAIALAALDIKNPRPLPRLSRDV